MLLNVHVSERPYFEHLRVTEAILSGAVVVSEPGAGSTRSYPGSTSRAAGRSRSPTLPRSWPTTTSSAVRCRRRPGPSSPSTRSARRPSGSPRPRRSSPARSARATPRRPAAAPAPPPAAPRPPGEDPDVAVTHRALKQLRLESIDMRAGWRGSRPELAGEGRGAVEVVDRTPVVRVRAAGHVGDRGPVQPRAPHRGGARLGRAQHAPRGGGHRGRRRLGGRVGGPGERVDGRASVGARRARAPPLEPGLPHARNTALDFARGPLMFVLDADNGFTRTAWRGSRRRWRPSRTRASPTASSSASTARGPAGLVSYAAGIPSGCAR